MAEKNTEYGLTDSRYMGEIDFLIKQLKVEWNRSKQVYKTVSFKPEQSDELMETVNQIMSDYKTDKDDNELTFRQSLKKTKEGYILLRLAKKIIKAVKKMNQHGREESIYLDKEEFSVYMQNFKQETNG